MTVNANLFTALRAAFPADLDSTAIDVADGPTAGAHYSWADLDRGTAMLANLLHSLGLPAGSRVAVQTEKSVEALMLYLAVLRAGYVFLPLNTTSSAMPGRRWWCVPPRTLPGSAASPSVPARPMSSPWVKRGRAACWSAPPPRVTSTCLR